jgi:hypothetical protein
VWCLVKNNLSGKFEFGPGEVRIGGLRMPSTFEQIDPKISLLDMASRAAVQAEFSASGKGYASGLVAGVLYTVMAQKKAWL